MKTRKYHLLLAFLALIISDCFSQEIWPRIEGENIFFPSNQKIITFESFLKKEVGKKIPNNTEYSIKNLSNGAIVFIAKKQLQNNWEYSLYFFSEKGELTAKSGVLFGSFKILTLSKAKRIILGDQSLLTRSTSSYVFSFSGEEIYSFSHDSSVVEIGYEKEQQYMWFISNRTRDAREGEELMYPSMPYIPYNHIEVFNVIDGKKVYEVDSEKTNGIDIDITGRKFRIELPVADIPG